MRRLTSLLAAVGLGASMLVAPLVSAADPSAPPPTASETGRPAGPTLPLPSSSPTGRPAGPTQPPAPIDVYVTPGTFLLNGRLWSTTCAAYSPNQQRCRTEIWSSTVVLRDGRYVVETGWHFNNLTYPAQLTKTQWGDNRLATAGTWTDSTGRPWVTECGTAATGPLGCRTYILVRVIVASRGATGWSYSTRDQFVLNNMVRFAAE